MPSSPTTAAQQRIAPKSNQDGSAAGLIQRFATPFTTGLFVVSAISGVALFLHWMPSTFHSMHEWLSMVLLLPFVFHIVKNWRPFVMYMRRGWLFVPVALSLVAAAAFAYVGTTNTSRGNPGRRAASVLAQAPLTDLAPLLKTTPDRLLAVLNERGYDARSANQNLNDLAKAANKAPTEALAAVLQPQP